MLRGNPRVLLGYLACLIYCLVVLK